MEHIGSERDMEYSGLGKGLMILQRKIRMDLWKCRNSWK